MAAALSTGAVFAPRIVHAEEQPDDVFVRYTPIFALKYQESARLTPPEPQTHLRRPSHGYHRAHSSRTDAAF